MTGREILFDGSHLRAELHNPDREVLFVRFDNLRLARDGFPGFDPSDKVAARGLAELSITSAQNDWFLNPDMEPLRQVLHGLTGRYRAVRCIAFSMGGYGALLFSAALRLRHAVLVSPQYSPFPQVPPCDPRYRRYAKGLDPAVGDLGPVMDRSLRGVVLFDPVGNPMDRAQARLILAQLPNMGGVAMPFGGHPATSAMAGTPAARKVRDLAMAGKSDPALYRALHVAARVASPVYQGQMRAALAKRAERPMQK